MRLTVAKIVGFLLLVMGLFHLYAGGIQLFPATQQRAVHLSLGLAIIFLIYPLLKGKKNSLKSTELSNKKWIITFNFILSALAILIGIYIFVNYISIIEGLQNPTPIAI